MDVRVTECNHRVASSTGWSRSRPRGAFVRAGLVRDAAPCNAVLAEKERRLIGERTRAASAERRKAGVRLGNPVNATEAVARPHTAVASRPPRRIALQSAGVTDLRGLAAALNARGIPTARGGKWYVSNVRNIIARSGRDSESPSSRPFSRREKPRTPSLRSRLPVTS
jgi:hypothetical protein